MFRSESDEDAVAIAGRSGRDLAVGVDVDFSRLFDDQARGDERVLNAAVGGVSRKCRGVTSRDGRE